MKTNEIAVKQIHIMYMEAKDDKITSRQQYFSHPEQAVAWLEAHTRLRAKNAILMTACKEVLGWLEEAAQPIYDPELEDEGMIEIIAQLKAAIGGI